MVTGRVHRMTQLFGRLAPGEDLEQARAELRTIHGSMVKQYPEAYPAQVDFRIDAARLRDEVTSNARTVLLILLAASTLVFVIASSNVANLFWRGRCGGRGAGIRAALGAGTAALRRTLLAESLLLCVRGRGPGCSGCAAAGDGAGEYASQVLSRALDLTIDSSMVWVGVVLAIVAAVLLAFVPSLPDAGAAHGYKMEAPG